LTKVIQVQAPGLNRRQIGEYIVTALVDGIIDLPFDLLAGINPDEAEAMILAAGRPRSSAMTVSAYLVEGGGRTILIDSGAGGVNGWGGRLQVALAAANIDPRQVDHVFLTHAHPDHVGGLIGPSPSAVLFPNAELVLHEEEYKFWSDDGNLSRAPEAEQPFFQLARSVFAAYGNRRRTVIDGEVVPGIALVHLPGHTPGHSGYRIGSGAETLLIWGDIVHYPNIQVQRPAVTIAFDVDSAAASVTRRAVLAMASAENPLIAGMHLNFPGFARVRASGGSYTILDEPWCPSLI
jgi:glyoxylase-like metal-dependent hydrolase (beta-lactamase superfamily II)